MHAPTAQPPLVSGGYFIGLRRPRPLHMDPGSNPETILSASDCLMAHAPHTWAIEWSTDTVEERARAAGQFGIDGPTLRRMTAWTTAAIDTGEIGWPGVFVDLSVARRFRSMFVPSTEHLMIFGIALPRDLRDAFIDAAAPGPGMGNPGVYAAIVADRPPAPGGEIIGYEVLCWDMGGFHSSRCNGLEADFQDVLGIESGADGFPTDLSSARRCADFAGLESTGAEPGLWQPWRITVYPPA